MNPDINKLQPYPFEKLNRLKATTTPSSQLQHISLSIGEPKHAPPQFVLDMLARNLDKVSLYPSTKGIPELRESIALWATQRFNLQSGTLTADQHVLPVNGTREALFSFVQAVIDRQDNPLVVCPNPFYQIYEGAAYLAGATPYYLNCQEENNYIPDFNAVPSDVWNKCQLLFLCTPGNPTGSVTDIESLKNLIRLADKYNFIIASDECYSELYFNEQTPPPGLLQACRELGRNDYHRCVVFHSLSKRSNLPGLRSGFIAGDANILSKTLLYRTYHGCAMPVSAQLASIAAWQDEQHVVENRHQYREKFDAVLAIVQDRIKIHKPEAGFYLWLQTPISDTDFAKKLYAEQNITVLPGSFIARETPTGNPGCNHVRIALVAPLSECIEAGKRIQLFLDSL